MKGGYDGMTLVYKSSEVMKLLHTMKEMYALPYLFEEVPCQKLLIVCFHYVRARKSTAKNEKEK